jgi:hypothetical protein
MGWHLVFGLGGVVFAFYRVVFSLVWDFLALLCLVSWVIGLGDTGI